MPLFVLRHWRGLSLLFIMATIFFFCSQIFFPFIQNSGEIISHHQKQKVWEESFRHAALVREFRSSEVLIEAVWKEINKDKKKK